MKFRLSIATAAIALFTASVAHANTVTFDDAVGNANLYNRGGGGGTAGYSITDQGLTFTNQGFFMAITSASTMPTDPSYGASDGTNQLSFAGFTGDKAVITLAGGGLFDVQSIDIGIGEYGTKATDSVLINGTSYAIGTTMATVALDLTNISELDISNIISENAYWNADNIVFSAASPAAVPEPLTLSLFGAGLAGAAAMRRRKKKA